VLNCHRLSGFTDRFGRAVLADVSHRRLRSVRRGEVNAVKPHFAAGVTVRRD